MTSTKAAKSNDKQVHQSTTANLSVRSIAEKFLELCNAGRHFDFMHGYYAPEIVSVEGDGKEYAGKGPVIHKSEVFQSNNTIHTQDIRGPYFSGDPGASTGQFAVHFAIEYSPKAGGPRGRLEEVSLYTVRNGLVTREQFFYDGAFI